MLKVLVTGATGFISSQLAKDLGFSPIGLWDGLKKTFAQVEGTE